MTPKQQEQFNRMLATLKKIARGYSSPDQLRRDAEKKYGLDEAEALEYAYQNIQADAADACKGVRPIAATTSNPRDDASTDTPASAKV